MRGLGAGSPCLAVGGWGQSRHGRSPQGDQCGCARVSACVGAWKHCVCKDIGWTGTSVGVPASERARRGRERGCGSTGGWAWGCVCACVYKMARGAWGDVCASRRGVVFLLYLAFIDRVKDPVPRNHYIFAHSSCTLRSLRYFCTLRSLRYPAYFMCVWRGVFVFTCVYLCFVFVQVHLQTFVAFPQYLYVFFPQECMALALGGRGRVHHECWFSILCFGVMCALLNPGAGDVESSSKADNRRESLADGVASMLGIG